MVILSQDEDSIIILENTFYINEDYYSVDEAGTEDRTLRFFYYDELEDKIKYESIFDEEGNYIQEAITEYDCIDFTVEIPKVLLKMFKKGIIN